MSFLSRRCTCLDPAAESTTRCAQCYALSLRFARSSKRFSQNNSSICQVGWFDAAMAAKTLGSFIEAQAKRICEYEVFR